MAKIADTKLKNSSGGYARVFGNKKLGDICSKIHSTNIRNGHDLEHIIEAESTLIPDGDLDKFIDDLYKSPGPVDEGVYLCTKKIYKKSKYKVPGHEPDYIVFDIRTDRRDCHIVELKDGDDFDTKKAESEHTTLVACQTALAPWVPCKVDYAICSFNQDDKDAIVVGFKKKFARDETMTGREFCDMLGLDYQKILTDRTVDCDSNVEWLLDEILGAYTVEALAEKLAARDGFADAFSAAIDYDAAA